MPDDASVSVPTLEMRNVSKTFPGVKALNGVQLRAWGGEVLALMGENGAGKSTLMKILSGAYQPDPGAEILINGERVDIGDPIAAKRHGIAIIYQELALAPNLTVAENIYLGDEIHHRGLVDRNAMYENCRPVLERLGARSARRRPSASCRSPSSSSSRSPEPCTPSPRFSFWTNPRPPFLRARRAPVRAGAPVARRGHRAHLHQPPHGGGIRALGSRLGAPGRHLCRHPARDEITAEALVKMMVGRDLSTFYKKEHDPNGVRGPVILEVDGVTDGGRRVKPCSFQLHKGEVLGIAGLVGSGRTELARLIFGADPKVGGEIRSRAAPRHHRTSRPWSTASPISPRTGRRWDCSST